MYVCIYIYTSPCPDDFSMRSMVGPCRFQQKKDRRPTRQDTSDLENPKLSRVTPWETVDAIGMPWGCRTVVRPSKETIPDCKLVKKNPSNYGFTMV